MKSCVYSLLKFCIIGFIFESILKKSSLGSILATNKLLLSIGMLIKETLSYSKTEDFSKPSS